MSRRVHRVPVHLDANGVGRLPFEDLKAILRGADEMINRGGRTLLCAVLRGSRRREVLEHGSTAFLCTATSAVCSRAR
jgi:hypothetical protein